MFHTLWVASGIAETAYKTDNPSPVPTRIVSPFSLQEECDKMEKHYMDFKEAYVRAQKTSELDTEVVRGVWLLLGNETLYLYFLQIFSFHFYKDHLRVSYTIFLDAAIRK